MPNFNIITGDGGFITVNDDDDLELGHDFQFIFTNIYIDTTIGADKNIIFKDGACRFYVSAATEGDIIFEITGGASVTASGIPSGEYDSIVVTGDASDLKIYINSALRDSDTMTIDVPPNGSNWVFLSGNTVRYCGSFQLLK